MVNSDNKWWSKLRITGLMNKEDLSAESFYVSFVDHALNNDLCVYKHNLNGKPREGFALFYKALEELATKAGLRSFVQENMIITEANVGNGAKVFISDDSCLYISISRPSASDDDWIPKSMRKRRDAVSVNLDASYTLYIEVLSFNKEFSEAVASLRTQLSTSKVEASHVYLAVSRNGQTYFDSVGLGGQALIEENYDAGVREKFNAVVADMMDETPAGRLTIIDGPPGTGKSYLIRALIHECKHCMFVFIPSEMVASMAGPVLGATLLDYKEEGRPIVLIIEDEDECLTKRDRGNMGAISTLLNISAGLLGDLIDIRVVCTTNTEFAELDDAAKRDCRLLEHIEIGEITGEQAQEAYKKVTEGAVSPEIHKDEKYTLAKVYALAKKGKIHDKKEHKTVKRKVGFGN